MLKFRFEEHQTDSIAVYVAAHNQLSKAELELASEKRQRLAILQKLVEDLQSLETLAVAKYRSGGGGTAPMSDQLLATANRLQAEIDYVREELKPD